MSLIQVVVLVIAGVACIWDLRTRRIPNLLTLGAAVLAVLFHLATQGVDGGVASVGGWIVGIAVLFAPFALGGMGAGDLKLLGALGAWLGPADALWLTLYTGTCGAVIALGFAAIRGYLPQALRNIWLLLSYWRVMGIRPMGELTLQTAGGPRLAYATSILAGTVTTLWLR